MSQQDDHITTAPEEYFDSKPTGVELEDAGHDPEKIQPWDPDLIRVHTKHFSLRQIVDMIQDGDIDLAPDFQRLYVWHDRQKSSLLESILLGIPLPSFYFNEQEDGTMQVVDGLQRLTTIFDFVRNECKPKLGTVDYLKEVQGRSFEQLEATFQRRMNNTQLVVHVIDPQTPYRVKFDIFRRINTGGSPLSSQEIRHCMSLKRSRSLLFRLTQSDSFQQATGGSLKNHIRMADREVVLRACAFSIFGPSNYRSSDSLDAFLVRATEHVDSAKQFSDDDLNLLEARFDRAMRNAIAIFGDYAFRKWPLDVARRNPINRALFEVWTVTLMRYDEELVRERADNLRDAARNLMTTDKAFIEAISQGTGDARRVRTRFRLVASVAEEVFA